VSYDPNENLLAIALANREALMAAQKAVVGRGGNGSGNGAAKIPQLATSEKQTGGGPNDNLLAIAMAEREKLMGSSSARKPAARATAGSARPTRAAASAPRMPQPAAGQGEKGGANDNLLAIALAERARAGSSPRRAASPARGSYGSARASKPTAASRPASAPKISESGGPNDNLLEIALAERARAGSSPRRSATPPRRSASPTNVRASPKVGPFEGSMQVL